LPVEQLKDVPEPVVVLLEALLQKDPARRFQNPTELVIRDEAEFKRDLENAPGVAVIIVKQ
jgi:hypothetical protein